MKLVERFIPFAFLLIILLAIESAILMGFIPEYLVPKPSSILNALWEDPVTFRDGFITTLWASLLGFCASVLIGGATAMFFSLVPFLRKSLLPFAVFFQTVPIVAIAPVLVIWFGFGIPTVVASSFICSVFPIIANTLLGLDSIDQDLLDLFKIYRANRIKVLLQLRLPNALPQIFTGFEIASGLAVIGAIVGEFVAGGGLGGIVDASRTQNRLDKVFAAVFLSAILGAIWIWAMKQTSNKVLKPFSKMEHK